MVGSSRDGAPVWDEPDLDAHDYALLCAYTHPEAPAPELALVTDWYTWVFYFDDHFLQAFKRPRDLAGARCHLGRLPAFMPFEGAIKAEPQGPVERGLADLWGRTVPTMSAAWRHRFAESTRNLLEESLWELSNISQGRLPNPIEYVEMRRKVGGAPWSANLVEHAVRAEVLAAAGWPERAGDDRSAHPPHAGRPGAAAAEQPQARPPPGGGRTELPAFSMPFATRVSPHLAAARRASIDWARDVGILAAPGIWDERRLRGLDFAVAAASIHPEGSRGEVTMVARWLTWRTYADDYFPAVHGRPRDVIGARAFVERLPQFMPLAPAGASAPANPVERGLGDLWARTAPPLGAAARERLRHAVVTMIESWLWELANHLENRIPDPIDYIEMRRRTFGADLTMMLGRLTRDSRPPSDLSRHARMLENVAADYCCLLNDIFSYQKEIQFEGELHNCVLVTERFLGCDTRRAVEVVNDLMTQRMSQFQHITGTELPALYQERGLAVAARAAVEAHVSSLQDWMAGVLEWHRRTRRYDESELRILAGLGMSAARVP